MKMPERLWMRPDELGDPDFTPELTSKDDPEGMMYVSDEVVRKLVLAILDMRDLISCSDGVIGLHMNGDSAPWEELEAEGRFEEWLGSLDPALNIIEEVYKDIKL